MYEIVYVHDIVTMVVVRGIPQVTQPERGSPMHTCHVRECLNKSGWLLFEHKIFFIMYAAGFDC